MGTSKISQDTFDYADSGYYRFFFLLSFPIPDSSVLEAVSIRVHGLFHPRYQRTDLWSQGILISVTLNKTDSN